jgi:hypothetical protein
MLAIRYPGENPLKSEEEAWAFLEWLTQQPDYAVIEELPLIKPSWASFNLHYDGPVFDATLTPPILEALLVLQSGIYRSYALVKYGQERANRLTDFDKQNTQIVVRVRPGTTGVDIDATDIAKHFLDVVGHSMNGVEVTIAVVTAIVLFFGHSGLKIVMAELSKSKAKAIESAERTTERAEDVRQAIALSQEETKRTEILREVIEHFPKVSAIQHEALKVVESTLKSVSSVDEVKIQGKSVSGPVAADLIANPRSSSELISFKSRFQIMSVDSSSTDGFRARLKNTQNGEIFNASLKDTFLSKKEGETVQQAFWEKRLVLLELDAKLLRGQIKDAEIVQATILDQAAPILEV